MSNILIDGKDCHQLPNGLFESNDGDLYMRCSQCNRVNYTDGTGKKCSIWMQKGTMEAACAYFKAENWEELAKYPVWGELCS